MTRPVLKRRTLGYKPVSERELDEAISYAKLDRPQILYTRGKKKGQVKRKAYVGQNLDQDLLRILVNTALERRLPVSRLALLTANTIREAIPMFSGTALEVAQRYEGYKSGAMKIMSIRRVWQMKRDARREEQGVPTPKRPPQTAYPEDPKKPNQFRLFS